jgi:hypothetical protein
MKKRKPVLHYELMPAKAGGFESPQFDLVAVVGAAFILVAALLV